MRWPGEHLEDAQNVFALAEAVQEHAHRADIDGVRSQPDQVAVQARQLRQHHAHPLRLRRNFQAQQLLRRQAIAQVIRERRQIIHAVGQGDRLLVILDLELFLDPGVQIADIGLALDDDFAVQLHQQAQHAVRGRVLRAHVEDHAARPGLCASADSRVAGKLVGDFDGSLMAKSSTPSRDNLSAADGLPNRPAS